MDHRAADTPWRKLFRVYLASGLGAGLTYLAVLPLLGARWTLGGTAILFVAMGIASYLDFRHRERDAAIVFVGGVYLSTEWLVATTGGVHSANLIWLTLLPLMAATLLGIRAAVWMAAVDVATLLGIALAAPWLPHELEGPPISTVLGTLGGVSAVALHTLFGFTTIRSYQRVQSELLAAHDTALRAAASAEARHADLRAVLDNVAEGLLRVDLTGTILPGRSPVVDQWFGRVEDGAKIWDVLRPFGPHLANMIEFAWSDLAADVMPASVVLDQLPTQLERGGVTFGISFRPIGTPVSSVLVVIDDISEEVAVRAARARDADLLALFDRSLSDPTMVAQSLGELDALLRHASGLAETLARQGGHDPELRAALARDLHTFKGAAAMAGMQRISSFAHETEDLLAQKGEVSPHDLSTLVERWSEIDRRVARWMGRVNETSSVPRAELDAVLAELARRDHAAVLRRVQRWTWERVSTRLEGYAESAKRVALSLDKPEPRTAIDADQVLAPPSLSPLWAALAHAVRNAVDHGIESEEERERAGKDPRGELIFRAIERDLSLEVAIVDDGRGIDWKRVAQKAEKAGLPYGSEGELLEALFADGISTREQVSEISGRGVGMGALRETVRDLGGTLTVESEIGRGTTLRVCVPVASEEVEAAAA